MVLRIADNVRGAKFLVKRLTDNDSVPEGKPIGNLGAYDVAYIVKGVFFGFAEQAIPHLNRANRWIDQGLSSKEYDWFGPSPASHRHFLLEAKAIGTWLEANELDANKWNETRRFLEAWWKDENHPWSRQEIIRDGLDKYMPLAVLGGLFEDHKDGKEPFEAGIDMYKHWIGRQDVSLAGTLKPRELGYAMCRHYLNDEFDREELLQAGRRMLAAQLSNEIGNGWLENGATIEAAIWLVAIYWYPALHFGEEFPQPVNVLLKIYDDLPGVENLAPGFDLADIDGANSNTCVYGPVDSEGGNSSSSGNGFNPNPLPDPDSSPVDTNNTLSGSPSSAPSLNPSGGITPAPIINVGGGVSFGPAVSGSPTNPTGGGVSGMVTF